MNSDICQRFSHDLAIALDAHVEQQCLGGGSKDVCCPSGKVGMTLLALKQLVVSSITNQISNGVLQDYDDKTCDDVLKYIKMRAKQHCRVPKYRCKSTLRMLISINSHIQSIL
jgi:hypothetical protein